MADTTGKALVNHWPWAAEKGLMNKNTAAGLKAACAQVLSVYDDWQTKDVKTLDVEDTLTRFVHLRSNKFKPRVLETYKQRFRQALVSFRSFAEDPSGWKPKASNRPAGSHHPRNGNGTTSATPHVEAVVQPIPTLGLVEYPFPLREGQTNVRLILPRDLKTVEVKRLAAFMNTLAADYEVKE